MWGRGRDQAGAMLGTIFSSWRVLMGVHLSPLPITMARGSLIEQMSVNVSQVVFTHVQMSSPLTQPPADMSVHTC